MDVNSIINAILMNNPQAVANNLVQLGIIPSANNLETGSLKTILYNMSLQGQDALVRQAINVPILENEAYADYLKSLAEKNDTPDKIEGCNCKPEKGISLNGLIEVGLLLATGLLILTLLKKLFK